MPSSSFARRTAAQLAPSEANGPITATASRPRIPFILGAVVFLSPWLGGFAAAAAAAWTTWIIGIALIVFAAVAMSMNNTDVGVAKTDTRV